MATGAEAIAIIQQAALAGQMIGSGSRMRVSSGVGGPSFDPVAPVNQARFNIRGTLQAGGLYTGNILFGSQAAIQTNTATLGTVSLGLVNTASTFTLLNLCEAGTSLHFVGTNTYVQAIRGNLLDVTASPARAIWEFSIAPPPMVRVGVTQNGGSNGTYPAGSSATVASWTYDVTLGSVKILTTAGMVMHRAFAGNTTAGTAGWCSFNPGTNVYQLEWVDESQAGDVCAT